MSEQIEPVQEKFYTSMDSFKDILKSIPKRFLILISKMLSGKFLVLVMAGYFLYSDKMDQYGFIIISGLFLFGRYFLTFIENIKK